MDLWFSEHHTPNVKLSIRVDRQLYAGQSEFQRIDVFESPEFGRFLTLDGYMMLTEKDEFIYHEMIVHVPMAVHPNIKKVLVIGAGDGGVIRELTRYDHIEHIDMVEIDPDVVEVCRAYLPKTAGPGWTTRVYASTTRTASSSYACGRLRPRIVDSTDPFGPVGTVPREFYGNCYKLHEDGIMVSRQPVLRRDAIACQRAQAHCRVAPISRVYQAHTYPSGHWLFGLRPKVSSAQESGQAAGWLWSVLQMLHALHKGAFIPPMLGVVKRC
ncbi:MAG: spermidine synthase [Butyricicoccus pullicaecorum]